MSYYKPKRWRRGRKPRKRKRKTYYYGPRRYKRYKGKDPLGRTFYSQKMNPTWWDRNQKYMLPVMYGTAGGLASAGVKYLADLLNTEIKTKSQNKSVDKNEMGSDVVDIYGRWVFNFTDQIVQSTTASSAETRIGNSIRVKSIAIGYRLYDSTSASPVRMRVIIFIDKWWNGKPGASASSQNDNIRFGMLDYGSTTNGPGQVDALYRIRYFGRWRILHDKSYVVVPGTNRAEAHWRGTFYPKSKAQWGDIMATEIPADTTKGHILMMVIQEANTANACKMKLNYRIRFVDD